MDKWINPIESLSKYYTDCPELNSFIKSNNANPNNVKIIKNGDSFKNYIHQTKEVVKCIKTEVDVSHNDTNYVLYYEEWC